MLRTAIRVLMLLSFTTAAPAMGLADVPPQSTPPLSEVPPSPAVPANGGAHPLSLLLELPDPPLQLPPVVPGGPMGLPDFDVPPELGVPPGPPTSLPPIGDLPPDFGRPPELGVPPGPPDALPPLGDLPPHFATPLTGRSFTVTPEPTTGLLVGFGLVALAGGHVRRRSPLEQGRREKP